MTADRERELTTEALAAYLEGEVTASEAHRIEQQLEEYPATRRRLSSLQQIRDALVQPIPELDAVDLVPALRTAVAEPVRPAAARHARWRSVMPWVAAAATVCMVVGLGLRRSSDRTQGMASGNAPPVQDTAVLFAPAPADEEFRSKSAGSQIDRARWAGVQIYRVHHGSRPERVGKKLSRADGLLFTYTNLGQTAFEYLMIFALDAAGELRWFHPAYERQGENPESIPIRKGEADVPLPELIHHDLATGPLRFHALFSAQPLSVLQVEAAMAGKPRAETVVLPNVVDHVVTVQVEP